MREPRRTFAPVALVGIAAAIMTAVAGARTWALPVLTAEDAAVTVLPSDSAGQMPLASALSLVALAAWGVLLVTRGPVRRIVAGIGALAAAGTLATVVTGLWALPAAWRDAYAAYSVSGVDLTGWYAAAWVGATLTTVSLVAAVWLAPHWPEMGSRYDAPGAEREIPEDRTSLDLWRALDEGEDPTA